MQLQGTYTPATGVWTIRALPFEAQATLTLVAQVVQAGKIYERGHEDGRRPGRPERWTILRLCRPHEHARARWPQADIEVRKHADALGAAGRH